ncbi:MAG: sulfurtransferase-like selenium metabolism protein YedF [Nitrospirota bacterium]|nr:sulfurtransferase-like selenium metabolism protein YedF [Nitrospirota bacterium]
MKRVDARGLGCPKPVVMAEEVLDTIEEGTVEVLVDNEASVGNLGRFARKNGMHVKTEKKNGYWSVRITKGYVCDFTPEETVSKEESAEEKTGKDILMIIGTDTLGKDEELGKILMKGFFETMKVTRDLPDMIFFLNAGVKLTTINEEIIPSIRDIESMGVEIFSCGTCLKHYGLESELKAGYRGTTNHIVEGIKDFGKVVWI